jgi:hypothetical protein
MNQSKAYRWNPSVISTEFDGGAILLNVDNKHYYNLNETAFRIWQNFEKCQDLSEIGAKLAIEYEVDAEIVSESLSRIVKKLEKENLILPNK